MLEGSCTVLARVYLTEEVLAWLLRSSGYRLLTENDDPARPPWKVLEKRKHGLVVRGRGAWHQADTLGEFPYVPPSPEDALSPAR